MRRHASTSKRMERKTSLKKQELSSESTSLINVGSHFLSHILSDLMILSKPPTAPAPSSPITLRRALRDVVNLVEKLKHDRAQLQDCDTEDSSIRAIETRLYELSLIASKTKVNIFCAVYFRSSQRYNDPFPCTECP